MNDQAAHQSAHQAALDTALAAATAAAEKKAEDIVVLDLRGISSFADFFVIASGKSDPQLKAIASGVREGVREKLGIRPHAMDGVPGSQWLVIDYGDVLVHVMHGTRREFYALDDLWSDAPLIAWESTPSTSS